MIAALSPSADRADLTAIFDVLAERFDVAVQRLGRREELLTIAGLRLRVSFAGDAMRDRLLPALPRVSASAESDLTLLVWDCASASLSAPLPWRFEDIDARGAISIATSDSMRTAYSVGSSALSMLDLARGLALFRARDAHELPWWERASPFRSILHWALEARGRRFVHAAAVANENGGALLAGRGGSGKSTTAMLCLENGFAYAGDDYVGVSIDDDVPQAHALFTSAKLSASSVDWLPFLHDAICVAPSDSEKGVAMLGERFPRQIASSLPLHAVIVPRVTGGTSRLQRISGGAALRALAPTTLLQLPGSGAETFAALANLVRRLPAWSLDLGDDRTEIPRLVARAIEESR
ncbi:MAG TPA: hypothetical protein VGQ76_17985 [Thermoanaerobaculia bacterium]|jgi:hypothetical protein|nr:hypothetical protein [Thermoanaerobaculia bacterium]